MGECRMLDWLRTSCCPAIPNYISCLVDFLSVVVQIDDNDS